MVEHEDPDSAARGFSEKDARVILSGPAVWVNSFYTTSDPYGLKITFAEQNLGLDLPVFRAAVYLDRGSAAALAELLLKFLHVQELAPNGDE